YITFSLGAEIIDCNDAITRALKNNPQHQKVKTDKNIANLQNWTSISNRLPSLTAGYNRIRNNAEIGFYMDSTTFVVVQPLEMGQMSVDVSWPLFTGGSLLSAQKISSKSIKASELFVNESRENTKLETIKAYYDVIKMNGVLSISQSAKELVNENLKMVNRMFEIGLVQKKDILRAEVSSMEIDQQIQQAEQGVQLSKMNLNMVMGESLDSNFELVETIPDVQLDYTLEELLNHANEYRPVLQSARIGTDITGLGIKAARGSFVPSVAGIFHWQKDTESSILSGGNQSWRAMVNVSLEIPFGFSNSAKYQIAKAQHRQSKYSLMEAEHGINLEVKANFLQFQLAESSLDLANKQSSIAEENYKEVVAGFQLGKSSQIELIDARNTLYNAQINQMNILIDHAVSYYRLLVSAGYSIEL
ncbi:MAG: TolC family protein, partial [Fidelibacterota bacterium]